MRETTEHSADYESLIFGRAAYFSYNFPPRRWPYLQFEHRRDSAVQVPTIDLTSPFTCVGKITRAKCTHDAFDLIK